MPSPRFSQTILANVPKTFLDVRLGHAAGNASLFLSNEREENSNVEGVDVLDPLKMWIIQLGIIMAITQILSLLLMKIRQPRVISEVLGGIILSPSILGRIPGFTETIFPDSSKPYLSLVANIGLILFLFLVGLEIDGALIRRNARLSAFIALGGMVIPFGLGSAFSVALYKEFIDPNIKYSHFLLFVGVAFSITAFPVLCRILTELKLLDTSVGVIVLSAGVANDIVGWTLLALSVALVNASSSLTAVKILLACITWTLFLLFPVRKAFHWLARRTGSLQDGPTMFFMTVTMLLVFCSAFVTDVIGVHAIFGSFVAGLIIPREGGLAVVLTEKIEDVVSIVFLPLYFTLSGLSTDFGLLNDRITWAYTLGIISIAWIGKFGGCAAAARISGFQWREAATIGTLMSCKGLVELIVLNVGLSAGILNTRVFSMFVLEALVLTFLTTPVVVALYPPKFRKRATALDEPNDQHPQSGKNPAHYLKTGDKARFTVILDKLEHMPGIMTMAHLFRPLQLELPRKVPVGSARDTDEGNVLPGALDATSSPMMSALRVIELSDRTSAVMKSSMADSLVHTDPLLDVFKTLCEINHVPVSVDLAVLPFPELVSKVVDHAKENHSHLVLVPWLPRSSTGNATDHHVANDDVPKKTSKEVESVPSNETSRTGPAEQSFSGLHSQFVRGIFSQSTVDVALFVDRGRTTSKPYITQHIILLFFGGPDDRLALNMVVQLCKTPETTATVYYIKNNNYTVNEHEGGYTSEHMQGPNTQGTTSGSGSQEVAQTSTTTRTRLDSKPHDDDTLWQSFVNPPSSVIPAMRVALEKIHFTEIESFTPLREGLFRIEGAANFSLQQNARPFFMVGRGRGHPSAETYHKELVSIIEERGDVTPDLRATMGEVATAILISMSTVGLLIVQSI